MNQGDFFDKFVDFFICFFFRELIRQAFSAWEIVISMDFLELTINNNTSNTKADIVFNFFNDYSEILNENLKTEHQKLGTTGNF